MTQHAHKFALTTNAAHPILVNDRKFVGLQPDDVLLRSETGGLARLARVRTDAGHLLDAAGGVSIDMVDVVSDIRAKHYGVSNFGGVMHTLQLTWTRSFEFQQGPNEAWLRMHHVRSFACTGLKVHGYRVNGHDGPKEAIQLRSGTHFQFKGCEVDAPISIGPNLVDGVIDPHAEPVDFVQFIDCRLRALPRIVKPLEFVKEVLILNCWVASHFYKRLTLRHKSFATLDGQELALEPTPEGTNNDPS